MRKSSSDILAGLGFLAVALAFGVQYEGLTGVSRVFPESLITFIALGGIWFVGKGLWRRRSERGKEGATPGGERTAWRRVAAITVFALCYARGYHHSGLLCLHRSISVPCLLFSGHKRTELRYQGSSRDDFLRCILAADLGRVRQAAQCPNP